MPADILSVNELAKPLVESLIADALKLKISVAYRTNGCCVVDAGIEIEGSMEAGRRVAEICMAGLGKVSITQPQNFFEGLSQVTVTTQHPALSCLGSQYAGWSLEYKNGKTFRALGSGPARALAVKEVLYQHLGYKDYFDSSCLVIETDQFPPNGLIEKIASSCKIEAKDLTLILTPTGSLAGVTQIAARVVEVALHKAHELNFDLSAIVEAIGTAPVSPPVDDFLTAMGRTNDTILFAGQVALFVNCGDEAAEALAQDLPSSNSRDYGIPFAQKFSEYNYDFFKIDPMLFSPARVAVTEVYSGRSYFAGHIDKELLRKSLFSS